MLIGKQETFAVEYELDKNHGGLWMFGKVCYWVNNIQIGDYELGTSLRDVLFAMKYLVHDCGNREGLILCELSPEEVFFQLNESIYGDVENINANLPDTPARFNITLPIDVFSRWKIYLIDCSYLSTIIFKNDIEKSVQCFQVKKGEFDDVINNLYCSLNSIYESIEEV
jgi:hypothetical protein